MTTTVRLITHGWPVQVTTTDHGANGEEFHSEDRVEPGTERDFYVHSTRSLSFKELPAEAARETVQADVHAAGDAAPDHPAEVGEVV